MAWPLIWYYLIALYMFIWVVTGQGPHQCHWALGCLWVRVMFITSIRFNLYIRPCILVCAFLNETFYRTAGPSHKAWYWNHGLRWQTSFVCRSCGKWHAICSIRLLQCALCWCLNFFEHVVLRSCTANCGMSSIFKSQMAVGFSNAITTYVSFGVFIINKKNHRFHPFCPVSSNAFWVCLVYLA